MAVSVVDDKLELYSNLPHQFEWLVPVSATNNVFGMANLPGLLNLESRFNGANKATAI